MEKRCKNATESQGNIKRSICDSDVLKHKMYKVPPPELDEGTFPCPVTRNMRHLLDEFKGLYEERLRRLEFETGGESHEEILRMKVRILNSYVNDLSDQNQVLIQTVEDLEKEANGKVTFLEAKIHSSDQIIGDLGYQKRCLEDSRENLRSEMVDMKLDISTLSRLVQQVQHTHTLDVSGVTLRTIPLEQIAEASVYSKHISKPEDIMKAHVRDLQSQLKAKDRIIQNLREEIKQSSLERIQSEKNEPSEGRHAIVFLQRKVDSLQTLELEKVTQLTERDITIAKLHTELQVAEQDGRDMQKEMSNQREKVNELQEALRQLKDQMAAKDVQSEALLQCSRDMEEKATALTAELQKSRERLQKQQMELVSAKRKEDGLLTEWQAQEQRVVKVELEQRQKQEEALRLASLTERLNVQLLEARDLHTQATCQLDATKRELEGARAQLAEARRRSDAWQVESEAKMATVKNELSQEYGNKLREHELRGRQINEELHDLKEKHGSAKEELSKLQKIVDEQEMELKNLHLRHRVIKEDNGRLLARLEAQTVTAQSEQDVFTSEISSTEGVIHTMRLQQLEREKDISQAAQQIYALETVLQEEREKSLAAESETQRLCQVIHSLEKQLQQVQLAEKDAVSKINEREERVRHLQLDLTSLRATQDSLKRAVMVKEHSNGELSQECTDLRQTLGCLQNKLQYSEEKVNSLDLEVGLLKSKLQEKTEQSQQLQDEIVKQQEALSRANETLKDTRKAAGNKIHKKENKLGVMQKDLIEAQTKYSECKNELLRRENLLQKLKEETGRLTAQIKEQSQDINKLSSEKKKLQLELTVVMEKHRTAQQEVNNRDQAILQLKTDLKAREERHHGAQEELGLQESEVSRLNERVKSLQKELRGTWERSREEEARADRAQEEKQNLQLQLHAAQQQLQYQVKVVEQLTSDLDNTKQGHTTDMERWNQKTQLLQNQLDQSCMDLLDSQSKAQEHRLKSREMEDRLHQNQALYQEALAKIQDGAELVKKQTTEMLHLHQHLEDVQTELRETSNAAKNHEMTADIFRQKYQMAMDKAQQLEGHIQSLEEEVCYANKQVLEAQDVVSGLQAEISNVEGLYEEKRKQMENSEDAIDQLTEELQTTQEKLMSSSNRTLECEKLIEKLKEQVGIQHKEILDHENTFLQLQSQLTSYQFSHSYSNKEFEAQQKHCDVLQKELASQKEQLEEQLEEQQAWKEGRDRSTQQLKTAVLGLREELQTRVRESQGLERALQSLHLDAASAQQAHKAALAQLEQEVAQLEVDLSEARKTSAQREQAMGKRDDLLKKSEADLLQAQEAIKGTSLQLEHLKRTVEDLRGDLQAVEKDKSQKQQENLALRSEVKRLNEELHDLHKQHRETAQERAGREERAALLESSLSAAREQLRERTEEEARQEQSVRTTQAQLRNAVQRARAAEEEATELRLMVERLQTDAGAVKESLKQAQQEAAGREQERQRAEVEHDGSRKEVLNLTRQLQQQEEAMRCLREELGQEHTRYQDQQRQLTKLKTYMENMETELEHLRIKQTGDANTARCYEDSLTKQKADLQEATDSLTACKEDLQRAEESIASLQQERSLLKDEVEAKAECLKTEQCLFREKLEAAAAELETQRLAAQQAREDNARLRQESQLAVASVNRWIREQKMANEGLAGKIKEQNKLLTIVSAEKDHLQETKDAMEVDLRKQRAVIDENKKEIGHLKAIHSHSANQQALLNQLRGRLEVEEIERESLMTRNLCQIEGMQARLKANMESITLLNEQLSTVSAENAELRRLLEQERAQRRQLEVLLKRPRSPWSPSTGSLSQRLPLTPLRPPPLAQPAAPPRGPSSGPEGGETAALTRGDLEEARMRDSPDKSYWIQRVGELSAQLQESTEYWSEKMSDLAAEVEHAQFASPKK
ncbi:nuclear mitotic apparatus protein 1-like isoform X1 [Conger conger]|uniref:nuclear mitotic apparatus protein 1-like isoform X1 n=1 Tax=Conger conger TaxID=82655 RepID=UPI002A5A97E5|nr:nuclear mitotic apparatus protein 1-like isoform X1 [Conger conger]